ncbi:DinB family protein [Cyclobacterium marinum]|uniref:DinB family protein n=1 Tax=Cyclobacterium marinum TaxID=104 RepID=UPI0011EFC64B|nr:DinB family protein [Cyclobacterium marinum]MBI0401718.1 DinB family protein [Cyclobacterium marinum]
MKATFKTWKTSRNLFLTLLESYKLEQLNHIPQGFNNNLIWNIGHVIVAQQGLVYKGSGLPAQISDEMFGKYGIGTKPETPVSADEYKELKSLLMDLIPQTESEYFNGKFVSYHERTTKTGFHLSSVEDAIVFNNFHEGLHMGYVMSIRKFI